MIVYDGATEGDAYGLTKGPTTWTTRKHSATGGWLDERTEESREGLSIVIYTTKDEEE